MAGKSKPNILNLGQEASYQVLSLVGSQGSGGTVQLPGLFDGNNPNEWNTLKVMYWQTADNFIEINISTPKVNIWRSGTTSWKQYIGSLKIKYWNGSSYVDVTNNYLQTVTQIAETQWEKTILDLPSGRYRFEYGTAFRLIPNGSLKLQFQVESYFHQVINIIRLLKIKARTSELILIY